MPDEEGTYEGGEPVFSSPTSLPDEPDPNVTFLTCGIAEAVATALRAAGGKNLEILGADLASQCLQLGRSDEILVYALPGALGRRGPLRPQPSTGSTSNHSTTPSRAPSPCSASACLAPRACPNSPDSLPACRRGDQRPMRDLAYASRPRADRAARHIGRTRTWERRTDGAPFERRRATAGHLLLGGADLDQSATTRGFDGRNFNFPEEAATYWLARFNLPAGRPLAVAGRYPHGRYMSLNAYSDGAPTDALSDVDIEPRPGSVNPFVLGARRDLPQRSWRVRVVIARRRPPIRRRECPTRSTRSRGRALRSSCSTGCTSPTAGTASRAGPACRHRS